MEEATFGYWLRQRRRSLDLTQSELARRAGCSEITVRKIEAAERMPSPLLALALAECLQLAGHERSALLAFVHGERNALPSSAPAVALETPIDELALPLTPILGRDLEAAQILGRVLDAGTRLLTLVGPPGIGKTRLGLHIAGLMQTHVELDVCFVVLAPLQDPALVLPTVMRALRITPRGDEPPLDTLARALRDRQLLLVLDNFEHVAAAAPRLVELLRMAPRVTALVTSRAALRVTGENVYPVPPLAQPDPPLAGSEPPLLEAYGRAPAVQLFVERAPAIRPDWSLNQENAPDVAAICARLDGIPLAVELAAARMRLFTPRALASRLQRADSLSLLVKGQHDLPAHERTLRGAIDWSYRLLGPAEQALFARLGIFSGGFTTAAAAVVVAEQPPEAGARTAPDPDAMLDDIIKLANQSLLQVEGHDDGELRFSMLGTIREYAIEKLNAGGALETTRRRHAAYFAALAASAALHLGGRGQQQWLDQLQADNHNLRYALEWFAEHDAQAGLRCAAGLRRFWLVRGMLSEGRAWIDRLLASAERQPAASGELSEPEAAERRFTIEARAQALLASGELAYQQGDHQQAQQASSASLELYRGLGAQDGAVAALLTLGRVALGQADYQRAAAIYDECLALYQALDDKAGLARTLRERALIAKDQGSLDQALQLQHQALQHYRQLGDTHGVTVVLYDLSTTAYWQADYQRAGALAGQAAEICRTLGNQVGLAYALEGIAMAAHQQGSHADAAQTLAHSLRLFRGLDEKAGMALVLNELGLLAHERGDPAQAGQYHRDGLALAWRIGDRRRVCFCLEGCAAVIGACRPLDAARWFGAASALREALGTPVLPSERASYADAIAAARIGAGSAGFDAAWNAGRALQPADAVNEALGLAAGPASNT